MPSRVALWSRPEEGLSAALERLSSGLAISRTARRGRLAKVEDGSFEAARHHADLTRRAGLRASMAGLEAIERTVLARAAMLRRPGAAARVMGAIDHARAERLFEGPRPGDAGA